MDINTFGHSQTPYDSNPRDPTAGVWRPSALPRDSSSASSIAQLPRDSQTDTHSNRNGDHSNRSGDNGFASSAFTAGDTGYHHNHHHASGLQHPSHQQHEYTTYRSHHEIKNESTSHQNTLSSSGLLALRYDSEHITSSHTNHHPSINPSPRATTHPDSASSSPCPAPNESANQSDSYNGSGGPSTYGTNPTYPPTLHLQDYVKNSTSSTTHCGIHQEYNAQYTLPMHPVTSHFGPADSHVTTNISPSHGGLFPSMNVNVSMNMNVHGVPTVVPPPGYYEPHTDPWGPPRIGGGPQSSFYPTPVPPGAADYLGHSSHHSGAYSSYTPMSHSGYTPVYESDTTRLSATLERDSYYKSVTGDSVSRLYSLSALNQRRQSGRLNSPFDVSGKVNLCRICGKTYARPSTLKTHMRTHSGEKPYKCTTCSKSFSQAANLTAHLRTHSGEKPFKCPLCNRRFSQSSSVTTHLRTHSGERPYRCRLCKKAFSDSSTLTKHLRIHSGEKPYQCKLCLLRFSQSGNLNRHMRVHAANGM